MPGPLALIGGALMLIPTMTGLFPPLANYLRQESNLRWPSLEPQVPDLLEAYYRKEITVNEFVSGMAKNGYSSDWAIKFMNTSEQILSATDLISAWRRELITEETLNKKLLESKFNLETIDILKKVTEFYPSPPDLIRFAVREVYNLDVRQKYGMDEDISENYLAEVGKAGLPVDQAKNFWAAHWELPSVRQGYEMLHRGIISLQDLKTLMVALDIMPYWRDKLIAMSYSRYTRVDIRRLNKEGLFKAEDMVAAYEEIGYPPDKAKIMAQLALKINFDAQSASTFEKVKDLRKRKLITQEEMDSSIEVLGYDPEVSEMVNSSIDYEELTKQVERDELMLANAYATGSMNIEQIQNYLSGQDLPADYVNNFIKDLELQRELNARTPSRTDAGNWLIDGVIDEKEYMRIMFDLGYRRPDIERYLTQLYIKQDKMKRKYMTKDTYQRWYVDGLLTDSQFTQRMIDLKYKPEDIEVMLVDLERDKSEKSRYT
jgi:hypothetical protein